MFKIVKITSLDGGIATEEALIESITRMAETESALKPLVKEDHSLDFSSKAWGEVFRVLKEEDDKNLPDEGEHAKVCGYRNGGVAEGVSAIQIGHMDSEHAWISIAHGPKSTLMTIADFITVEWEADEQWNKDFEAQTLFIFK